MLVHEPLQHLPFAELNGRSDWSCTFAPFLKTSEPFRRYPVLLLKTERRRETFQRILSNEERNLFVDVDTERKFESCFERLTRFVESFTHARLFEVDSFLSHKFEFKNR